MTLNEFKRQGNFTDEQIGKLIDQRRETVSRWRNGKVKNWPEYIVGKGLEMIMLDLHYAAKKQNN